jgi:hypothetical protein
MDRQNWWQEAFKRLHSSQVWTRKFKYSRCKFVWELIAPLVWSGLTAAVTIDRIYAMYGTGTSVTNIINQLKKNIRNGTLHLTLRV